ncbi:MAG TPA: hypothetical protein VN541_05570 [Tepidisphaeraceae bacterium]|nr:hypothetical protein [Tepidisphaeraceae bacterium]
MLGKSKLSWPDGLKQTDIRTEWFGKISRLAPGLTVEKAARQLREPYGTVRRWGVLFGYKFPDRRRSVSREQWSRVDWSRRDADIARELGVTRECVRLVRRARGMGPSAAQTVTRHLEHFVQINRDRLHGLLVEEVIAHCGTPLAYHVVRRVLRENDVRPHEPQSPLRNVDWRLPNRDLAQIWGASPRYIANLRARLDAGPAQWNARRRETDQNAKYAAALAQERQKAEAEREQKVAKKAKGRAKALV